MELAALSKDAKAAINRLDEMWRKVDAIRTEILGVTVTERPAGSFTVDEYRFRYKLPRGTATYQLREMVKDGKIKQVFMPMPDCIGKVRQMALYVPTPKRSKANGCDR